MWKTILFLLISMPIFANSDAKNITKEWPYLFPIWGQRAIDRGYNIQLPYGISGQFYLADQDLRIPTVNVRFNDGRVYDVSSLINIGNVDAKASAFTFRPNLWLFPFLNIYGIFGPANASVKVPLNSIDLPDQSIQLGVVSDVENKGFMYGIGSTFNGKISDIIFNIDFNFTWTAMKRFDEPFPASVVSFRFGKIFNVYNRQLVVWMGGMGQFLSADTVGRILAKDLAPSLESKATQITNARDTNCNQVGNVWIPKAGSEYTAVQCNSIAALAAIATKASDSSIDYQIEKKLVAIWNLILGANYEISKNWYVRSEIGIIKRTSLLLGFEYRF